MINAELQLLKCATLQGNYLYYHLLSGEDLPIKTQDDIHDFFEEHQGKEFVRFECDKFQYYDRVRYYYWFQEIVGRRNNLLTKGLKVIQKILRIHRNKNIVFQKGAQWFSITDELARYVISQEKWIKKVFNYTTCCDEVFLQTLIINSDFKQNLVKTDFDDDATMFMRINDWKMLEESDMLSARKFCCETDKNIINKIVDQYGIDKSNRSEVCQNVK